MGEQHIIKATRHWVETIVIGLNLCPFAKHELKANKIRFCVSLALTCDQLLTRLEAELIKLKQNFDVETTLLIHPEVLSNFNDYNQFLDTADTLLNTLNLEGIIQIASFHPKYQFADTDIEAVENYTNRSPYPMLHLIREASLTHALSNYPDPEKIPQNNIERLKVLGKAKIQTLWQACFE